MMWAVSSRFLEALKYPHQVATRVTCEISGVVEEVPIGRGGTVTVDGTNRIRRRANLPIIGSRAFIKRLRTPGAVFRIEHGIQFSDRPELVPVFTGELAPGGQGIGSNEASFTLLDYGAWLARTQLISPFTPSVTTTRVSAVHALVSQGKPGTELRNEVGDSGVVGAGRMWTGSRSDAIADIARDGNFTGFFLPDGAWVSRPIPAVSDQAVWQITPGDGGTLIGGTIDQPLASGPNTVTVRPSAWWQAWTQQTVSITNPADPRHPSKVGVIPLFIDSDTAESAGQARSIAARQLAYREGDQDTMQLDAIANPALEAGDVVRVVTPTVGQDVAEVFQHFITAFTLNLATGAMSVTTKRQVAIDG